MNTSEINRQAQIKLSSEQQILVSQHLNDGLEIWKRAIQEFNGKVVNIKLAVAAKAYANPHGLNYSNDTKALSVSDYNNSNYRALNGYNTKVNRWSEEINVAKDANNRLDAVATTIKDIENRIESNKKYINDLSSSMELMAEEYEDWKSIDEKVKKYEGKYPGRIRGIINMSRRL